MEHDMREYRAYIIFAGVFVIILLLGGIWLYSSREDKNSTMDGFASFKERYDTALVSHASGDYSTAIERFTSLLESPGIKSSQNKAWEGKLKTMLAYNLFSRNQNDDRMKAMKLYKEVINDPAMPPRTRAIVLIDLISRVSGQTRSFYKEYFPEEPFKSYLTAPETDRFAVLKATMKMLEQSDQIYPNSLAKYFLASDYASLIANKDLDAGMTEQDAAKMMQKYILDADKLIDKVSYEPSRLVQQYFFRAIGLASSDLVLKNVGPDGVKAAYELALAKAKPYEKNDYTVYWVAMNTRFFYSVFILLSLGESQSQDIVKLLKPFGETLNDKSIYGQLVRNTFVALKNAPDGDFKKSQALKLAKISPEFKQFLIAVNVISP